MITDPLPDDFPNVRPAPGWPDEAPPDFAIREGRSEILILGDRIGELLRGAKGWIRGRVRGAGRSSL